MKKPKIYGMSFASVYPLYVEKAAKRAGQKMRWMKSFFG